MNLTDLWIWQSPSWTDFQWQDELILPRLRDTRLKLGVLLGKAFLNTSTEQSLDTLLANIIASSAIENEQLNVESVRSSLAKHLGLSSEQLYPTSDRSEGLAAMMLDVLQNQHAPLTTPRLFQWHEWLFPSPKEDEWSSQTIIVGKLRGDEPMQVVSGRLDKQTVHFEAPPRDQLEQELDQFISWFNQSYQQSDLDPLLRAAITHFWFVTLHPFDDGNGRITRALTDMALAQADSQSVRLYAMSVAILENRKEYYQILEQSQSFDSAKDLTPWLLWFFDSLDISLDNAMSAIDATLLKTQFWQRHHDSGLSEGQVKVLNRLLGGGEKGFVEGISASQYQKVAKVSKATATRHLADLLDKLCIEKLPGGGRSTRYCIKF
ncbi:MAG: Fic family protein [Oleispira antarctica]|nr:Fic family protein [Oleispira antarctica]MBQ0792964.1 Fic family protein [Oleispira antarctica]